MIIIIDGYNVLKYKYSSKFISEDRRVRFIQLLSDYAHSREHDIYLVFDGGGYNHATAYRTDRLMVLYAGNTMTADDLIVSLLLKQLPDNTLLVSNDNALVKRANELNIAAIDGALFYTIIKQNNTSKNIIKERKDSVIRKMPGYESTQELDDLMMQIDTIPVKHDEQRTAKISSSSKDSRREKMLQRLVKKL